jgi:transporter family protein
MSYLPWTLVALAAYSLVPPLMSVATTGENPIPSSVATFYSNTVLVVATVAVVVATDDRLGPYLDHPDMAYVLGAGLCLSVGILAYYYALSQGPVSVVTPVFGMFFVTASVVGVLFLDEVFTVRKGVGILLAVVAVYLVAGPGPGN